MKGYTIAILIILFFAWFIKTEVYFDRNWLKKKKDYALNFRNRGNGC